LSNGVKPKNSSRIFGRFKCLSKNRIPIENCSVPEISAVSSAITEKAFAALAKLTISFLINFPHIKMISF